MNSNVKQFPHPHPNRTAPPSTGPDAEKLQRLLGQLVEATSRAAEPTPQRDKEIRIRNFRSSKYSLVDDLIIALEDRGNGEYVATSFDTGQYGHGYSPDNAIQHLCSVLEDYYELLLEDEGHLSERLDGHLRYLRSILRER
ncbi:MAG TPA: hypothetical protein VN493_26995 [Thermoanaerobaculia bacterium]|nr:hypothetical protein [Thermoanaerobaculia bacterium]